ncbi:MAG: hypothetical protein ACREQ4_04440 [Candidatus Binataceae bacterium]
MPLYYPESESSTSDSTAIAQWLAEMLAQCEQSKQQRVVQTAPGELSFEQRRNPTVRMMQTAR